MRVLHLRRREWGRENPLADGMSGKAAVLPQEPRTQYNEGDVIHPAIWSMAAHGERMGVLCDLNDRGLWRCTNTGKIVRQS